MADYSRPILVEQPDGTMRAMHANFAKAHTAFDEITGSVANYALDAGITENWQVLKLLREAQHALLQTCLEQTVQVGYKQGSLTDMPQWCLDQLDELTEKRKELLGEEDASDAVAAASPAKPLVACNHWIHLRLSSVEPIGLPPPCLKCSACLHTGN